METLSVPFANQSWTEQYDGMVTVRGVLRTEPEGLVLEFRPSENYFGAKPVREGEIRDTVIPWPDVQSITYRSRLLGWGGSLVLRTRNLRVLEGVPAARGVEVTFTIARGDRLAARELAANVELALAEDRLRALDTPSTRSALPSG